MACCSAIPAASNVLVVGNCLSDISSPVSLITFTASQEGMCLTFTAENPVLRGPITHGIPVVIPTTKAPPHLAKKDDQVDGHLNRAPVTGIVMCRILFSTPHEFK